MTDKNTQILNCLYQEMIAYYAGDPSRIQHFAKVHSFARLIGQMEGLDEELQIILEAAAYVHDIGIKPAEALYGECGGKLQEALGPEQAEKMMKKCGFSEPQVERVSYLVGHHHTYTGINGADYQILVEADFLVNLFEESSPMKSIQSVYQKIFKTESGKKICRTMFAMTE